MNSKELENAEGILTNYEFDNKFITFFYKIFGVDFGTSLYVFVRNGYCSAQDLFSGFSIKNMHFGFSSNEKKPYIKNVQLIKLINNHPTFQKTLEISGDSIKIDDIKNIINSPMFDTTNFDTINSELIIQITYCIYHQSQEITFVYAKYMDNFTEFSIDNLPKYCEMPYIYDFIEVINSDEICKQIADSDIIKMYRNLDGDFDEDFSLDLINLELSRNEELQKSSKIKKIEIMTNDGDDIEFCDKL